MAKLQFPHILVLHSCNSVIIHIFPIHVLIGLTPHDVFTYYMHLNYDNQVCTCTQMLILEAITANIWGVCECDVGVSLVTQHSPFNSETFSGYHRVW